MSNPRTHGTASASAGLAAAIAMAITQVVGLLLGQPVAAVLLYGLSFAAIAFGGTYAGLFFVGLARRRSTGAAVRGPAPTT